eukprot:jgi/Botrbrau1/11231/Bobra.0038s0003.1
MIPDALLQAVAEAAAANAPAELPRELVSKLAAAWGAIPATTSLAAAPALSAAGEVTISGPALPTFPPMALPSKAPKVATPAPAPLHTDVAVTVNLPTVKPGQAAKPLAAKPTAVPSRPASRVVPLEGPSDLAEADALAGQYAAIMASREANVQAAGLSRGYSHAPAVGQEAAPSNEHTTAVAEDVQTTTLARQARLKAESHVRAQAPALPNPQQLLKSLEKGARRIGSAVQQTVDRVADNTVKPIQNEFLALRNKEHLPKPAMLSLAEMKRSLPRLPTEAFAQGMPQPKLLRRFPNPLKEVLAAEKEALDALPDFSRPELPHP